MKKILNVSTILLLVLVVMACKHPTNETGGGSGTGGGEPTVIPDSDINVANFKPTVGISVDGTWSIASAASTSSDAKITVVGTSTTYVQIAEAIKTAITAPANTTVTVTTTKIGTALKEADVPMSVVLTASSGYIFDGNAQTKTISITFDIAVPDHYADSNDEDLSTLQEIINAASDGNTIAVTGTFRENITVGKTLTFIGYGSGGGIIDGNASATVILVDGTAADLTIGEGITITGGSAGKDYGAAIDVYKGTLTLDGGTITGNTNTADEGSIRVAGGGTFEMLSGSIDNNTGVGVFVSKGSAFNMYGGTIADNIDGGVFILYESPDFGSFTMAGGSITRNSAEHYGAGLWVSGGTGVAISGGSITGNINTSAAPGGDDLAALGTASTTTVTLSGAAIVGKWYQAEEEMINDRRQNKT